MENKHLEHLENAIDRLYREGFNDEAKAVQSLIQLYTELYASVTKES